MALTAWTGSPRTLWWADPEQMAEDSETGSQTTAVVAAPGGVYEDQYGGYAAYNLVASRLENGNHSPLLDVDFRTWLYPSTTPGRYHLYLDGVEMPWDEYRRLLVTLQEVGILGMGYVRHSIEREMTMVRRPGTFKLPKPEPEVSF